MPTPALVVDDATRTRLGHVLRTFAASTGEYEESRLCARVSLDTEALPSPPLLHFLLAEVMQFPDLGRSEKTAWCINFHVGGDLVELTFEKFGLRLYIWPSPDRVEQVEGLVEDICRRLTKAVFILERDVLRRFANEQVEAGNILIHNQYGSLRERYLYFRECARLSYEGQHLLPANKGLVDEAHVVPRNFMKKEAEGAHNTLAMVNAFFSLLEHSLVLLRPFLEPRLASVSDFISLKWGGKFKHVYDVVNDGSSRRYYQQLHDAAEQWRNPYSHGGFDKAGGGISIHFRSVGVVPASLTRVRSHPEFSFMPARRPDFTALCQLFDGIESWMQAAPRTRLPMRYVAGGMDVSYDPATIARYLSALQSDDSFERFCDERAMLEDQYANMEW
jgi:hypothetical protein